jgi:hypothetical protein
MHLNMLNILSVLQRRGESGKDKETGKREDKRRNSKQRNAAIKRTKRE